ncbi:MAG: hypothetical protein WBL98_11000, partial [Pseudolabrys sp.]
MLLARFEEALGAGAVCAFMLGHADLMRGATQSSRALVICGEKVTKVGLSLCGLLGFPGRIRTSDQPIT